MPLETGPRKLFAEMGGLGGTCCNQYKPSSNRPRPERLAEDLDSVAVKRPRLANVGGNREIHDRMNYNKYGLHSIGRRNLKVTGSRVHPEDRLDDK